MSKVYEYWQKVWEELKQENPQREMIPYPPNFREFTLFSLLENEPIFNSLISCYQKVFGSRDIWGEGAKCDNCGDVISIEKFVERKTQRNFFCSKCSGSYAQIFPADFLKKRILVELDPDIYKNPFIILYLDDGGKEVLGFCWGVVDTSQKIAERIIKNKYAGNKEMAELVQENLSKTFSPKELLVVYYDEIGILKEARKGLGPVSFLVRLGLEKGDKNKTTKAVYWTSKISPIYMICKLSGYEDFFVTSDGLIFCYIKSFEALMKVIQTTPIDFQEKVLATIARKFFS